jgi:hypothetical protein
MKKYKSPKRWDELLKRIPHDKKIKMAEIGVWRGVFAGRILRALPLLDWWGIDTWAPPPAGSSYALSGAEIVENNPEEFTLAYHMCVAMATTYPKRAHIVRSDSVRAAEQFEDASFDVVFIDADHSYEGCKRDILTWKSKVNPGGLLCGHDYANKKGEVKKAVDECLGKVELAEDHTWWKKIDNEAN